MLSKASSQNARLKRQKFKTVIDTSGIGTSCTVKKMTDKKLFTVSRISFWCNLQVYSSAMKIYFGYIFQTFFNSALESGKKWEWFFRAVGLQNQLVFGTFYP
jgi:hypothetical protein